MYVCMFVCVSLSLFIFGVYYPIQDTTNNRLLTFITNFFLIYTRLYMTGRTVRSYKNLKYNNV